MGRLKRDVASISAASVLLASVSAIAMPATAAGSSPLIAGDCGTTLSGKPGQPVSLNLESALGISGAPTISLGKAREGTRTFSVPGSELTQYLSGLPLLGAVIPSVCEVTVKAVNTAAAPVQEATEPVRERVKETTERVRESIGGGGGSDPGAPAPAPGGGSDSGGSSGGQQAGGEPREQERQPEPRNRPSSSDVYHPSSVPGSSGLPTTLASGYLPMDNFTSAPHTDDTFAPSPGVRYGNQIPGYSPEFGLLGQGDESEDREINNAGSADGLPSHGSGGIGMPMMIAVLALSAASAGLVRTWVLRRTFGAA
ncbi:hypothetical protein [Haloechinothrix sp. LS1_15]|uniref:hypothetical protein n=1 Tax=Haloechinothrix sp. LS1_15 TaxID=2652248 RepID=UPI002945E243|nr:hypothetical protein [Haloechinothrix sp. LS1_15]MDV6011027.1 hypothetical protein [Haloechinothrix sp. LS1_15]